LSRRHGKGKNRKAGAHKNAASPETLRWNQELLIPPKPEWMSASTYQALAELRRNLESA
jgi:hypothetical protein